MVWPAIIGAVGSIAGSFLSSHLNKQSAATSAKESYKYSKKLSQDNAELQRYLTQNQYQDTTSSMRSAGINPMLAISNGVSTPSVSTQSVTAPDSRAGDNFNELASTAFQFYQDTKRLRNETKLNKSNIELNDVLARKGVYDGDYAHEQSAYVNELNRQLMEFGPLKALAELENISATSAKIKNDIANSNRLTNAQINNLGYQNLGILSQNNVQNHTAKNLRQEIARTERYNKWADDHPYIYGFTQGGFKDTGTRILKFMGNNYRNYHSFR